MAQPVLNYLQLCYRAFPDTSAKLNQGRAFNLDAIERSVSQLRKVKQPLAYETLNSLLDQKHWWIEPYWVWPPKDHVDRALRKTAFDLWELPAKGESKGIDELLRAFKSIELVSIILRFVHPEHYGILSPPIERVLDVRRGDNAAETYLNYTRNLQSIRQHYGFKRAADADMALWVLHAKCFGQCPDPVVKKQYERDSYMWEMRAANLLTFLADFPNASAHDLENRKHDLVSVVACYLFELSVKKIAQQANERSTGQLSEVIDRLAKKGIIGQDKRKSWLECKETRNDLFHEGRVPSWTKRENLIEALLEIKSRSMKKPCC